jgi:hypothetical protein
MPAGIGVAGIGVAGVAGVGVEVGAPVGEVVGDGAGVCAGALGASALAEPPCGEDTAGAEGTVTSPPVVVCVGSMPATSGLAVVGSAAHAPRTHVDRTAAIAAPNDFILALFVEIGILRRRPRHRTGGAANETDAHTAKCRATRLAAPDPSVTIRARPDDQLSNQRDSFRLSGEIHQARPGK